jgi:hypothetical protein
MQMGGKTQKTKMSNNAVLKVILGLGSMLVGVLIAGCGGHIDNGLMHASPPAAHSYSVQGFGVAVTPSGTPVSGYAYSGNATFATQTSSGETFLHTGDHLFRLNCSGQPKVTDINHDWALVDLDGTKELWPYRTSQGLLKQGSGAPRALAKDASLAVEQSRTGLNLLELGTSHVNRKPYQLGSLARRISELAVAGVDGNGVAVVVINSGLEGSVRFEGSFEQRSKMLREVCRQLTHSSATAYIVSTRSRPVKLQQPPGALGIVLSAVRTPGRVVGAMLLSGEGGARPIPCWWDYKGVPHELPLPNDVDSGFATDINAAGVAVGWVGNEITNYASVWPTLNSVAKNVNSLLATDAPYELRAIDSIGLDGSLVALAQSRIISGQSQLLGLDPR